MRASMTCLGTLPFRKPGIFTSPATLRYARSRSFATSSGSISTDRRTTCLSVSSTVVCMQSEVTRKVDSPFAEVTLGNLRPGAPDPVRTADLPDGIVNPLDERPGDRGRSSRQSGLRPGGERAVQVLPTAPRRVRVGPVPEPV